MCRCAGLQRRGVSGAYAISRRKLFCGKSECSVFGGVALHLWLARCINTVFRKCRGSGKGETVISAQPHFSAAAAVDLPIAAIWAECGDMLDNRKKLSRAEGENAIIRSGTADNEAGVLGAWSDVAVAMAGGFGARA